MVSLSPQAARSRDSSESAVVGCNRTRCQRRVSRRGRWRTCALAPLRWGWRGAPPEAPSHRGRCETAVALVCTRHSSPTCRQGPPRLGLNGSRSFAPDLLFAFQANAVVALRCGSGETHVGIWARDGRIRRHPRRDRGGLPGCGLVPGSHHPGALRVDARAHARSPVHAATHSSATAHLSDKTRGVPRRRLARLSPVRERS